MAQRNIPRSVELVIGKFSIFGGSWSIYSSDRIDGKTVKGKMTFKDMFKPHGIEVNDFSILASSNQSILKTLESNINNIGKDTAVIVFQTDPLKDIMLPNQAFNIDTNLVQDHSATSLDEFADILCLDYYNKLSRIQEKINRPVLLVAADSKINIKLLPKNLSYIDKSWTQLVSDQLIEDSYYEWADRALAVHKFHNWKVEDFFRVEQLILNKNAIWQTDKNFAWDHPGNGAYQIMFNTLFEKIKEFV